MKPLSPSQPMFLCFCFFGVFVRVLRYEGEERKSPMRERESEEENKAKQSKKDVRTTHPTG